MAAGRGPLRHVCLGRSIGLFRRHFFLVAALAALVLMVVAGSARLVAMKATRAGSADPGGAQAGGAAPRSGRGHGGPGGGDPGGAGGGRATVVSAVPLVTHAFRDDIELIGVAKGRRSVTLTAAATQLVERVRFTDGQHVAKGAVLIELKSTEQNAGIAQSQARLVQAQREYDRYRKLGEQGWASKASVDQFEAAYHSAQADLAAARARENDRIIRAPFSGVVGLSDVAPGALVSPGAPIVTLDDVSVIIVDFQAPERYLSDVREGAPISAVADAYPGETFQGRVVRLDTRVDERTRAVTARAEFANAGGRLKPGMMLRASLPRGIRNSTAAPESAVAVQGDSAFLFVLRREGGRTVAEQRPVVIGLRQDDMAEVREGAEPGEQVVADGLNRVQPGQTVTVAPRRAAAGARPPA